MAVAFLERADIHSKEIHVMSLQTRRDTGQKYSEEKIVNLIYNNLFGYVKLKLKLKTKSEVIFLKFNLNFITLSFN